MRYIIIVALAFAFAGSAHGASNDLKAATRRIYERALVKE
jgi:hypothetical protein